CVCPLVFLLAGLKNIYILSQKICTVQGPWTEGHYSRGHDTFWERWSALGMVTASLRCNSPVCWSWVSFRSGFTSLQVKGCVIKYKNQNRNQRISFPSLGSS
uniref:Uncharacterized protein n=1 Tax=Paramormyrops kingsleyae TaxID=1676925 RepID=A0A3B3STR5_9TELE